MIHAKNQTSWPCGFREDILKCLLQTYKARNPQRGATFQPMGLFQKTFFKLRKINKNDFYIIPSKTTFNLSLLEGTEAISNSVEIS